MLSKASIKLNTKKLYAADGHAVKELLKVATTLYHASRYSLETGDDDDDDDGDIANAPITTRLSDVKAARTLASEVRRHLIPQRLASARCEGMKRVAQQHRIALRGDATSCPFIL